jgi:hypothetical protein
VSPEGADSDTQREIRPGMGAEVYIKTAERTPIGFLLEPIEATSGGPSASTEIAGRRDDAARSPT